MYLKRFQNLSLVDCLCQSTSTTYDNYIVQQIVNLINRHLKVIILPDVVGDAP